MCSRIIGRHRLDGHLPSAIMDSLHILPICTIQPDFEVLVNDVRDGLVPEETFWLSCYKAGEPSVHGKVRLSLNERDRSKVDYEGVDGVAFREGSEVGNI